MKSHLFCVILSVSGINSVLAQADYQDYYEAALKLYKESGLAYGTPTDNYEAIFSKLEPVLDIVEDSDGMDARVAIKSTTSESEISEAESKYLKRRRLGGWLSFETITAYLNVPVPLTYVCQAADIPQNYDVLLRIRAIVEAKEATLKEGGFERDGHDMTMRLLRSYLKGHSSNTVNSGRAEYLELIESAMKDKSVGDKIKVTFKAELYNQKTNEVLLNIASKTAYHRIPANPFYYKDNYFYSHSNITQFWKNQINEDHILYKKFQENISNPSWKRGYLPDYQSLVGALHMSYDNDFCDYYVKDYDGLAIVYSDANGQLHYLELHPAYEDEDDGNMYYYYKYAADAEREWQFHDAVSFWCQEDPDDASSDWYHEVLTNETAQNLHPDLFKEVATPEGIKPSARERAEARRREFKKRYYEERSK